MEDGSTDSLGESVGEGLDPELERSEVPRLVQSLHLFGHQRLMDVLPFAIGDVD